MSYIYLQFPDVEGFIKYLKEWGIHRYAIVQRKTMHKGFQTFFFRLTAKNDKEMVIATCDVHFIEGWQVDFNPEVYKAKKEKALTKIREAFKEEFTEMDAEYTAESRTEFPL